MRQYLVISLTILGTLWGSHSYATETDDCAATLVNIMMASDEKEQNQIRCDKGVDYFTKCAGKYSDENKFETAIAFVTEIKKTEYLVFTKECKND